MKKEAKRKKDHRKKNFPGVNEAGKRTLQVMVSLGEG